MTSPAGWYPDPDPDPDPEVEGYLRWWDGHGWTSTRMRGSEGQAWPARVQRVATRRAVPAGVWLLLPALAVVLLLVFVALGALLP